MPGIVGIIDKATNDKNQLDLKAMVASMLHESIYSAGSYCCHDNGLYAGWICHRGTFCDCMPIWNEQKNVLMIFFGEEYPDLGIFDELKVKHHQFSRKNASYLVHLYEEKGVSFLKDLNGWFSGILLDLRSKKIILFNDRYGMQKIYYYETDRVFYFASEAKAILKICSETRSLDMKSFGEYLSINCVLENRTLYKKVKLLPGGSAWTFDQNKTIEKESYFDPKIWENQPLLEEEYFFQKFKHTLTSVIPKYFRSKLDIGISLTGGLDTRIILANANIAAKKYPCYTFSGPYRECYDVKVARKVAKSCKQEHHVIQLGREFLSKFSEYADKTVYISDGYFGVTSAYEVYLNHLAGKIAPIRLTGNYGGEILRGIGGMLKPSDKNAKAFHPDLSKYINDAKDTLSGLYQSNYHPLTFNLFKEVPWLRNQGFVIEQSQLTPRTPYLDNDLVALVYRNPSMYEKNYGLSLRLIKEGNPVLSKILSDRGFGGNSKFPISTMNELYYDFLFKAEYAYNYGMPQWLASIDSKISFLKPEKLFLGRHKFAHFRVWFRDELSQYLKEILLDKKTLQRPLYDRKSIEELVRYHTNGQRNYTTQLGMLLNVELTQRLMIE